MGFIPVFTRNLYPLVHFLLLEAHRPQMGVTRSPASQITILVSHLCSYSSAHSQLSGRWDRSQSQGHLHGLCAPFPPNGPPQLTLEMLVPTSLAADDQPLKSSPESRLPIQQSQLIDETSTKTTYHPIGATMGSARLAGPGEGITVDARQNQRRC